MQPAASARGYQGVAGDVRFSAWRDCLTRIWSWRRLAVTMRLLTEKQWRWGALAVLICALPVCGATATAPSQAGAFDASTPLGMLKKADALNGAEPEAFAQFYNATNDDERRMAKTEARFDSEFGMLQLLVEKKWGKDAGDAITHAMEGQTIPDAEAAKLTVDGDHATLAWKDQSAPLKLIKVGGEWKIDLAATISTLGVTADQYIDGFHKMSAMVADFADAVDGGKLKTLSEAVADAKKRTAALSGPGE